MLEILTPHPRSRSIIIISLLLMIQGISWLVLAVFIAVLGITAVRNAAADHKPTAAALTTAFATLGGGFFFIISMLVLFFAWGTWRQKSWSYSGAVISEGILLLVCLASLCSGTIWPLLAEGVLAGVILIYLFANRQVRAVAQ